MAWANNINNIFHNVQERVADIFQPEYEDLPPRYQENKSNNYPVPQTEFMIKDTFGPTLDDGTQQSYSLSHISLEMEFDEVKKITNYFHESNRLGCGSYGTVFKGESADGTLLAVKLMDTPAEGGFVDEVKVLSKFRHPNLVILMGFARDRTHTIGKNQCCLVYEYLEGGDCANRLLKSRMKEVTFNAVQRVSVLFDCAKGLSHLHNCNPKAFHRDIKTPNILLDKNGTAKMADFGLACTTQNGEKKVDQISGTIGYACPDYIKTGMVTDSAEAYSFGMVIFEMLTNRPPAYENPEKTGYVYLMETINADVENVMQLLDETAAWPEKHTLELIKLAFKCAVNLPDRRCKFIEIVRVLRQLLSQIETITFRTDYAFEYKVGARCSTQWKNSGVNFNGIISKVNLNGTCTVIYEDNEVENDIPFNRITVTEPPPPPPKPPVPAETRKLGTVSVLKTKQLNRQNPVMGPTQKIKERHPGFAPIQENQTYDPMGQSQHQRSPPCPQTHGNNVPSNNYQRDCIRLDPYLTVGQSAATSSTSPRRYPNNMEYRSEYSADNKNTIPNWKCRLVCSVPDPAVVLYMNEHISIGRSHAPFNQEHSWEGLFTDKQKSCLSRDHFKIDVVKSEYGGISFVMRCLGMNGMFVNREFIAKDETRVLWHGDEVAVSEDLERNGSKLFLSFCFEIRPRSNNKYETEQEDQVAGGKIISGRWAIEGQERDRDSSDIYCLEIHGDSVFSDKKNGVRNLPTHQRQISYSQPLRLDIGLPALRIGVFQNSFWERVLITDLRWSTFIKENHFEIRAQRLSNPYSREKQSFRYTLKVKEPIILNDNLELGPGEEQTLNQGDRISFPRCTNTVYLLFIDLNYIPPVETVNLEDKEKPPVIGNMFVTIPSLVGQDIQKSSPIEENKSIGEVSTGISRDVSASAITPESVCVLPDDKPRTLPELDLIESGGTTVPSLGEEKELDTIKPPVEIKRESDDLF